MGSHCAISSLPWVYCTSTLEESKKQVKIRSDRDQKTGEYLRGTMRIFEELLLRGSTH